SEVRAAHGVAVRVATLELGAADLRDRLCEAIDGIDVGLLVSNAGRYGFGRFLDARLEDELAGLDVNARAPLVLAHEFARRLAAPPAAGLSLAPGAPPAGRPPPPPARAAAGPPPGPPAAPPPPGPGRGGAAPPPPAPGPAGAGAPAERPPPPSPAARRRPPA